MASNPCFALLWLILLFFIAWPVAGLCSGLWILLQVSISKWRSISPRNQFVFVWRTHIFCFSAFSSPLKHVLDSWPTATVFLKSLLRGQGRLEGQSKTAAVVVHNHEYRPLGFPSIHDGCYDRFSVLPVDEKYNLITKTKTSHT
jgi:hypothetical protein